MQHRFPSQIESYNLTITDLARRLTAHGCIYTSMELSSVPKDVQI